MLYAWAYIDFRVLVVQINQIRHPAGLEMRVFGVRLLVEEDVVHTLPHLQGYKVARKVTS